MTMEGNVLTQRQTEESGRTATHVREFYVDRMITVINEINYAFAITIVIKDAL